ncbi:hypothetical protein KJ865_03585, partial [Myxococcota bacterium]|nr:hypothetical protein [Myxococcota bacterium]
MPGKISLGVRRRSYMAPRIPHHLAIVVLVLLSGCDDEGTSTSNNTNNTSNVNNTNNVAQPALVLAFGEDLPPRVRTRLTSLLAPYAPSAAPVVLGSADTPPVLGTGSRVLGFGDHPLCDDLTGPSQRPQLAPEGYLLRTGLTTQGVPIACAGGSPSEDPGPFEPLGAVFGAYRLLERLGFAFMHPLEPLSPPQLAFPETLEEFSAPRWALRGLHLHTMHPVEMTHVLNGWGPGGTDDASGFEAMLPEWESVLEWSLANGQNTVQWVLLEAPEWMEFSRSEARRERLARLVGIAHEWGLRVGVDAPIALEQQNAFRLIPVTGGTLAEELTQLTDSLDWLMGAGFDFIATETGTSEFTHPDPARMVAWMDTMAAHLDEVHGVFALIKVHCSTGQTAEGYADPRTGEDININFLPHHADPRMGIMPHTVEFYAFNDPAPTYGNTDFMYMFDFLAYEAGRRRVVWYPETAYWVSFDVDVPLFLPVYGHRRLSDLRRIAGAENANLMGTGALERMDGQLIFSSGWEWGYWLNDVITARGAWDPHIEADDDTAFRRALLPLTSLFGDASGTLADLIVDTAMAQKALLIEGLIDGVPPDTIEQRNGQAYLQGVETWDDVSDLAASLPVTAASMTQPDRLGLVDMRTGAGNYSQEVEPLLAAMVSTFG